MRDLPTGTVTFVFTDVEGSTRLLDELGTDAYADALAEHRRLVRRIFRDRGGAEVDTQGDAFFYAFSRASDALAACEEATTELRSTGRIRLRVGVHTGEPALTDGGYVGVDVHRAARIAACGHGGQVVLSRTTRDLVPEAVLRDLGEHRLKDLARPERLFQLGGGVFPPLKSLNRTNLPVTSGPLLGREHEVMKIVGLITSGTRLVTLTGPGGSGKTRLSLQVAAELVDTYADGVFFVPLAPLRDPTLVPAALAATLNLPADSSLTESLSHRRVLLVIDNAEHLNVTEPIMELLSGAQGVDMLVTSRAPLRLSLEHEVPVEPLAEDAAVELFVLRAADGGANIAPDADVAAICRRLDCLPLAIELAAARAKLLGPSALLQRLDAALPLLTRGTHDAPARHQTLRATIDWSYDLLERENSAAFRKLAVFRGGFALEAAEHVAGADVDVLTTLLDQSLLKVVGGERFLILETIREYAFERLREAREADAAQRSHAEHFLALCEEISGDEFDVSKSLPRLDAEAGNIRAALAYFMDNGQFDDIAKAVSQMYRYWALRNLAEGMTWLERAAKTGDPALRAACLYGLAALAGRAGEPIRGRVAAHEAMRLFETIGDDRGAANSLGMLGAMASSTGDLAAAETHYTRAAELMRASGNLADLNVVLANLGYLSLARHDYDEAITRCTEQVALCRELGRNDQVALGLINLGYASLGRSDEEEAEAYFAEALSLADEVGDSLGVAYCLEGLAAGAAPVAPLDAARLLGAAAAERDSVAGSFEEVEREVHEKTVRAARAAAGDDAFANAWAEGQALSHADAVALAFAVMA